WLSRVEEDASNYSSDLAGDSGNCIHRSVPFLHCCDAQKLFGVKLPCDVLQEGSRLLAYHNARRHRIAGSYARQNGSIRNPEAVNTVNLQLAIAHRHRIAAHFCGAGLMPEGAKPIAKKPFQLRRAERARCYLPPRKRSKSSRVAKLANNGQSCD